VLTNEKPRYKLRVIMFKVSILLLVLESYLTRTSLKTVRNVFSGAIKVSGPDPVI
jgi:hypothetical protein